MFARQIRILPLQVQDCHIIDEKGVTRPDGIGIYQLIYTESGTGILHDSNGNEYILSPGDVVFFAPGTGHDYYGYNCDSWNITYITFDGSSLSDGLIDMLGIPSEIYVIRKTDFKNPADAASLFRLIAEEFAERSYVDDFITHTLLYRLLYLIYIAVHKDFIETAPKAAPLSNVLEYIRRHIKEPLSVEQLAEYSGTSVYSLYKGFRSYLNTTPAEYITARRLELAARLITETDMTIREIGFETGMTTRNHLHRAFRAKYGVTPSEYRALYSDVGEKKIFSKKSLPVYFVSADEITYEQEVSWENERDENSYAIMLCNKGCGILTDEMQNEYTVRPGYLCFLTPEAKCTMRPADGAWTLSRVSFNGLNINRLLAALGLTIPAVIRCDGEIIISHRYCKETVYSFSENMDALYRCAWDSSVRASLYKSVLIYELITFTGIASDAHTETIGAEQRIAPAVDMINMHYNKKLTVSELADAAGISESTLSNLFRVVFKKTPKEYITDVRINQAKRLLLRHMNRSVADIGKEVGFSSSSHFISAFRAKCSMTPEDYRNVYQY